MKKPKISIIVPIYNVEQYLARCLDSLTKQTFSNIEIICVNDGSTDDSAKILARYAKRDPRIQTIKQKNGGLSAARNTGLSAARGVFIMYCDPDDWFETTACEIMYRAITSSNADLAACGTNIIYEAQHELKQSDNDYYRIKFFGKKNIGREVVNNTDVSAWNKIYRKNIIDKYQIEFPVGLHYEDAYFFNAYAAVSNTIFYVNQKLYNYVRRVGSIMSKTFDKSPQAIEHLYIACKLYDFLAKNNVYQTYSTIFWDMFVKYFWFAKKWTTPDNAQAINNVTRRFINDHADDVRKLSTKTRRELFLLGTPLYLPYTIPHRIIRKLVHLSPMYRMGQRTLDKANSVHFEQDELQHFVDKLV